MSLRVTFRGGYRFDISSRGHTLITDQPTTDGGEDAGMTPVELFVASLGACVGYLVARYCARHSISSHGLSIDTDWSYAEQPHRVGSVELRVHLPAALTTQQRDGLMKVAHGCTVHQTLQIAPTINIKVMSQHVAV
jgi:putative redox protein